MSNRHSQKRTLVLQQWRRPVLQAYLSAALPTPGPTVKAFFTKSRHKGALTTTGSLLVFRQDRPEVACFCYLPCWAGGKTWRVLKTELKRPEERDATEALNSSSLMLEN